jgi:hypothetical protein
MGRWGWPEALPKFLFGERMRRRTKSGCFFINLLLTLCSRPFFFLQVRGHLQGCRKIHGALGMAGGAAKFLLGKGDALDQMCSSQQRQIFRQQDAGCLMSTHRQEDAQEVQMLWASFERGRRL